MSEQIAFLRKKGGGGGKYTETSLWTNSAPTNSFSAQDITLSEGMSDFKYLKIRCAISTSSSTGIFEDIVLVTELSNTSSATVNNTRDRLVLGLGRDTYDYERAYYYVSNTSIHFNPAYQSGTSTTTATKIIPLEILGLNELDHGKNFDETTLWTNSSPTSSWTTDPISLNDDISNYDYIKIVCRKSNTLADECQVLCPVSEFKTYSTGDGYGLSPTVYVSSYYYTRRFRYGSNTQVIVNNCYKYSASSGTTSAVSLLPVRIIGCKFK